MIWISVVQVNNGAEQWMGRALPQRAIHRFIVRETMLLIYQILMCATSVERR